MANTGLLTVGVAALFGVSTVLREETKDKAFCLNEVHDNGDLHALCLGPHVGSCLLHYMSSLTGEVC